MPGLLKVGVLVGLALVAACGHPAPRRHEAAIRNLVFEPRVLTVAPGDTIRWSNADIVPHTVTLAGADAKADHVDAGATFQLVVSGKDSLSYFCRYHPSMTGVLVIR